MVLNQKVDVQIEALPVVSAVLDNTKKSHVEVVGIIEHDGKQAVNARELHAEINVEAFELIKVEERDGKQAVNARGLHRFLGIGKDFSSWIKKQIERCDLVENQDFEVFTQKGGNLFGGRPTSEYALSVDAAKEISMMSQCEKGKQARRYFIEMEKRARTQGVPRTYLEALKSLVKSEEEKQALAETNKNQQLLLEQKQVENDKLVADSKRKDAEIKVYKPKAAYYDTIMENPSCTKVTSIAQDYGMSPQAFNDLLHDIGIQYKVDKQWILYQKYKDAGYVHSKPIPITHHDGHQTVRYLTIWTQKGRLFLYGLLKEKGILPMIERNVKNAAHK